jgi:predicted DNA-binding transcriptional regulator YafY
MTQGHHDTIAYRLSQILMKLNQGDHLDPAELAEEFGTHIRTIQRDLKVRMAYLLFAIF